MAQHPTTKNTSAYVLIRRTNPALRNPGDWERLEKAEAKRKRRALKKSQERA